MPVLLTNAFNPGDIDPGHTYPRANIVMQAIRPEIQQIQIEFEFGDMVNGKWVPGAQTPRRMVMVNPGADYTAIVSEEATADEDYLIYAGAKRVLYEYLIAKGHLSGTIE